MKTFLRLVTLGALLSAAAIAQEKYTNTNAPVLGGVAGTNTPVKLRSAEVKDHIGANAIVTGKIAEVNKSASLVRLNFDQPFPKQTFTAVVFSSKTNLFPNLDQLKDKTVEVSGKIMLYRSRPEIQLQTTNQLKVLEAPADAETK